MDASSDMIKYSQLFYPKINWIKGNAYDTDFEDNSFDVVHASFLFIHLSNPELAIMEIERILKPGGILYVIDVNDSTFKGPKVIERMIKKHKDFYEGNRNILNDLPKLAKNHNLFLKERYAVTVNNLSKVNQSNTENNVLKLSKKDMWTMFAFIGQREDTARYFQKAKDYYFKHPCTIEIQVQTHIYKKIVDEIN